MRILKPDDVERLSTAYLTDELSQEDAQDLRSHLSTVGWRELEERKAAMHKITPLRTEQQTAAQLRAELQARLEALGEVMTKARREHGFTVSFQFSPPDGFGRYTLVMLEITKKLC